MMGLFMLANLTLDLRMGRRNRRARGHELDDLVRLGLSVLRGAKAIMQRANKTEYGASPRMPESSFQSSVPLPWDRPTAQTPVQFVPGQITLADLAVLERRRNQFASEFATARAALSSLERRCHQHARSARSAERRLQLRRRFRHVIDGIGQALDQSVSRTGGVVIGVGLVTAATFLCGFNFGESYVAAFAIAATVICGLALAWLLLIRSPADGVLQGAAERAKAELSRIEPQQAAARSAAAGAQGRLATAQAEVDRAAQVLSSRLHQLLTCNWPGLAGIPFERFLEQVFLQLGFTVETTKASGDQGVDLIATAHGKRFAIQAKGYPGSTVGNHAIMEAHTGMAYYRCHACIVVTNSTFTRAARDCAQAVGCRLIDGSQIPSLIRGVLPF
jgi:hypothetical protein